MNPKQGAFLAAFAECASVTKAAKAAKVHRRIHYEWMEDPNYAARFAAAQIQAAQVLEDEAVRRAREGVDEPKFYKGALCYRQKWDEEEQKYVAYGKPLAIKRHSDALMMFLLRGLRPEKYRDRTELTGADGAPLESNLTVTFVKPPPVE